MQYLSFDPDVRLKPFVVSLWIVTGDDKCSQKVLSDGYSELIFHFGDAYQIRKGGQWQTQSKALVAGQVDKPVELQPSGASGMIGIKFTPTGLWRMFHWDMKKLTNEVIPLQELLKAEAVEIQEKLVLAPTNTDKIKIVETFLLKILTRVNQGYCVNPLLEEMIKFHGQISIAGLANKFQLSNRKLERLFNEQVGVSPKVYARIIRFKHIFNLMQKSRVTRGEAAYLCGYFDQPHFNKDFKNFSGEDPQRYFGQTHPFANFFLNR